MTQPTTLTKEELTENIWNIGNRLTGSNSEKQKQILDALTAFEESVRSEERETIQDILLAKLVEFPEEEIRALPSPTQDTQKDA